MEQNDISRNLGFGNHVGCCTSIGKFNQYVAPQHLMNSFVNGIELVDDSGNSYGNSMCYFALVDGQLHFIIDSFEVDGNLSASEEVTDAIIDYAKEWKDYKSRCEKAVDYINNYSVDKSFSFPLMKRWEENQVKGSIDYEFKTTLYKDLLNILQGENNEQR